MAEAALPDFLMRQRWYPAKDAGRPAVALSTLLPFAVPGLPAAVAVWKVTPPEQPPFLMFVPLALVPKEAADAAQVVGTPSAHAGAGADLVIVEAFSTDAFVRAWIGTLLQGGETAAGTVRLRAGGTDRLAEAGLDPAGGWNVRRGSAEQSNTSIRIGEGAILKAIRKLEEGVHPELEVGRFLTAEAGFAATPALLGWIELEGVKGAGAATLSVLQAFVPNAGDGWGWVLERLNRAALEGDAPLAEVSAWLRRLGARTAEMHIAFGADTTDPEFRPEQVRDEDLRAWTEAARTMARRALDGLEAAGRQSDPSARDLAASLLARRDALEEVLSTLTHPIGGMAKARHHGDYHLGQVLVADRDAVIVDFEGEPLRPLAERRAKHAQLRDVAGMLRSLAYAAAATGRALPENLTAARRETAQRRLEAWEAEASRDFLDAYLAAAQGAPGLPRERTEAERMLRFFMLEKALYEIAYELANRPDWVAIPLRGVLALLDAGAAATRTHAMPFGAAVQADGTVRFRLWAPSHAEIRLELDGAEDLLTLHPVGEGWHELTTNRARTGTRYHFVLPDGLRVPDPASRHQPEDVHGPSEVIDPAAYAWRDTAWRGRRWEDAVV